MEVLPELQDLLRREFFKPITIKLPPTLLEIIDREASRLGYRRSEFIRKAILYYLSVIKKNNEKRIKIRKIVLS